MANTTWNPSDKGAPITLTGGNLIATLSSTGFQCIRAIDKQVSGKFYWECTCNVIAGSLMAIGFMASAVSLSSGLTSGASPGTVGLANGGRLWVDGTIVPSATVALGATPAGTVVCVALDCSARLVWFRLGAAGGWNSPSVANPATGTGGISVAVGAGIPAFPALTLGSTSGDQATANFGDTAFTGAVPAGFTSGFTAGVTSPTNALATQSSIEHWLTTNPDQRVTQVVLEHWGTVTGTGLQAIATQIALEHWASVAVVPTSINGPFISMIN